MAGVVSGFFVIAVIVTVGAFAGWCNLLGPQGRFVLNRLTYFIAGPCLVFVSLIDSDLHLILSANFAVAALAALLTTLLAAHFPPAGFPPHRDFLGFGLDGQ